MHKDNTAMPLFPNGSVANAETVIYITDLAEQAKRVYGALSREKKIELKEAYQSIQSDLEGLSQSIQNLSRQIADQDLCPRCHHIKTSDLHQLHQHIDKAADRLSQLTDSWPREDFVRRMRTALAPGDEIVFISLGSVSILRADGTSEVIRQRKN